jgi:outer membrane receptor for ferrienterochelin and colicins
MLLASLLFILNLAQAQDQLGTIVVQDIKEKLIRSGKIKDTIIKTELISSKDIEKKQAKNLTEAIDNEPGVVAQSGCSICGIKRVQINGLKGEYTTVLVDDIPLHSTVSSYYGFDALSTAGVNRIEIARGAGASLIAPEAIGGVINIISKKATENSLFIDGAIGNHDYLPLSVVGTAVSKDGKLRSTISGMSYGQGQFDEDDNGINESPRRKTQTINSRFSYDLTETTNLDFRLNHLSSTTVGGPMKDSMFAPAVSSGNLAFENNNVNGKYKGTHDQITESVNIDRTESILKVTKQLSEKTNLLLSGSFAQQLQDSYYEGNDYAHKDYTYFTDARLNRELNANHMLTIGIDNKNEQMHSHSYKYFNVLGVQKDDFHYNALGGYIQDTWTPNSKTEISLAARMNQINLDYTAQKAKKDEINKFLIAPRMHLKYMHTNELNSRLSYGQGYRAPLTFFESEHGILDNGFDVSVNKLEQSHSGTYSLNYSDNLMNAEISAAWTKLKNMAFIDFTGTRPNLKNYTGTTEVTTYDALIARRFYTNFNLGTSHEHFHYSKAYKGHIPQAAIENRTRILFDYDKDKWEGVATFNYIWARDLAPYNYGKRYEGFNDVNGNNRYDSGTDTIKTNTEKRTKAPSFFTLDLKLSYKINENANVYAGVNNLFNYTQVKKESPLFFDASGNFDVIHIWGPMQGRQLYSGMQVLF